MFYIEKSISFDETLLQNWLIFLFLGDTGDSPKLLSPNELVASWQKLTGPTIQRT